MDAQLVRIVIGAALVLIGGAVMQGGVLRKLGWGPVSVVIHGNRPARTPRSAVAVGVLLTVIGMAVVVTGFLPAAMTTGSVPGTPEAAPPAASSPPRTSAVSPGGARSVRGRWEGSLGAVKLAVTQVDAANGLVTLHLEAVNNSPVTVMLIAPGNFTATDDRGTTYHAAAILTGWPYLVQSGQTAKGTIKLDMPLTAGATSLSVSFDSVIGSPVYGPLTVEDVGLPR
ncbi:hypothetical protein GCM10010174_75660 [Kutzneria viridogrisea]|uniref:DUF4352 domain-containing protein n=2 Tax=Kutzneria TaxID=43356 RepID=W5W7B0_9PSEU|nr:hypothetical protein [Kutzneria albida]AHH96431.1 hypothetical protein KALB_3063 [Kutzneria albida DSM 43870]MBA8928352.1 hypothetical protein [Kutzneria viridogrisea]